MTVEFKDPKYDSTSILKPEFDVVYQTTNGKAHLPTAEDFEELLTNTTQEFVEIRVVVVDSSELAVMSSVFGMLFKSKVNDNNIFLPTVEPLDGNIYQLDNSGCGKYHTSSLYTGFDEEPENIFDMVFDFIGNKSYVVPDFAHLATTIRPVMD